jgi:hypothetical protein
LDVTVGDEAGGEAEERLVDVVASLPADPQAAEAVQPGDGPLDDPSEDAQAPAVWPVVPVIAFQVSKRWCLSVRYSAAVSM